MGGGIQTTKVCCFDMGIDEWDFFTSKIERVVFVNSIKSENIVSIKFKVMRYMQILCFAFLQTFTAVL